MKRKILKKYVLLASGFIYDKSQLECDEFTHQMGWNREDGSFEVAFIVATSNNFNKLHRKANKLQIYGKD